MNKIYLTWANPISSVLYTEGSIEYGGTLSPSRELNEVRGDDKPLEVSISRLHNSLASVVETSEQLAHLSDAESPRRFLATLSQKSSVIILSGTRYRRPLMSTSSTLSLSWA